MLCTKSTLIILCVEMAIYVLMLKLTDLKVGPRFEPLVSHLLGISNRAFNFSEP